MGGLLDNPGGKVRCCTRASGRGAHAGFVFPFFVVGGGFNTTVTLINTEAVKVAIVRLTVFDETGTQMGDPFTTRDSAKGRRRNWTWTSILGPGGSRRGYFELRIGQTISNPFASIPRLAGMVRFVADGESPRRRPC